MIVYGAGVVVLILILGIIFYFIRRSHLNNQSEVSVSINGVDVNTATQVSGMDNSLMQGGMVANLNKDQTLNTLMNSEEIVNNSFVTSIEENAAKRVSNVVTSESAVATSNNGNIANN